MSTVSWTCHACGALREDEWISVAKLRVQMPHDIDGHVVTMNARYCNDRLACLRGAADRLALWSNAFVAAEEP